MAPRLRCFLASVHFITFFALSFSKNLTGHSCRLTTGIRGVCRPYHECPYVNENISSTINRLHCGSSKVDPLMCCPFPMKRKRDAMPNSKEVKARRPGEAAKYWCEKYLNACSGEYDLIQIPELRVGRSVHNFPKPSKKSRSIDLEPFGTTEGPIIETTTTESLQFIPFSNGGLEIPEERIKDEFPHMRFCFPVNSYPDKMQLDLKYIENFFKQAAIGFGNESNIKWSCGGALISEKFVLTSAHCLLYSDGGPVRWVSLGSSFLPVDGRTAAINSYEGQIHYVIRRIRHPLYRISSRYNDLALIEFGPSLGIPPRTVMSIGLHPACLQVENEITTKEVIASWWARNIYDPNGRLDLKKVRMNILNNSTCNGQRMHSSLICIGDKQGPAWDRCRDELGGPLQIKLENGYCKYKIIGIKSSGILCNREDSTVLYTRVSDFIPWIESVLWPEM